MFGNVAVAQGEPGSPGMTGPPGSPGRGLPGPKVRPIFLHEDICALGFNSNLDDVFRESLGLQEQLDL